MFTVLHFRSRKLLCGITDLTISKDIFCMLAAECLKNVLKYMYQVRPDT